MYLKMLIHCVQVVPIDDSAVMSYSSSKSPPSTSVRLPSPSPGLVSPTSPRSFSTISTTPSRVVQLPEFWRQETQEALDEGILYESVRGDITRTLVTLLTARYGPKPSRTHYEYLARQLILKYPFAKDDLGSGYVSILHVVIVFDIYMYLCSPLGCLK